MGPHKCPVCNGQGHVSTPPWIAGDVETWTSASIETYECRVCNGAGIVWGPTLATPAQGGGDAPE